tara:strand:+ start:49 stop:2535 length:2487 start_codon:yes stop_codon:yes gene_type:complete
MKETTAKMNTALKNDIIINSVWDIQCKLRAKGITGMEALFQITIILLGRSLTKKKCKKFNIPEDLSWEAIKDLNSTDRYVKFYNPSNQRACLFYYLRENDRWGLSKDIPFKIKDPSMLDYIVNKLDAIPINLLESSFDVIGDIYEHFINREGKTMKDLGQYFTDRSLIEYLVSITKPTIKENGDIESVWDPAAGTGGFLSMYIKHLNNKYCSIDWNVQKHNIYAGDISSNTFTLLKQNIYYAINDIMSTFTLGDGLELDALQEEFDVILMNPPFGIKGLKYKNMNQKIKELKINGTKGEILFLQNCMAHLAPGGRCAIVVPEGVLFNSTKMFKKTRKYLLENFELHKVIKVGEGDFFKNTGVKTSVLFFERSGNPTSKVSFVQVDKVDGSIVEKPLLNVDMSKIIENDYSLNMNLFRDITLNVSKDFDVVKLGDIITGFKTGKYIPNTNGSLYPYYNSNGIIGNMDTFMFDGEYIIQASSGDCDKNTFYYKGKFNTTNFTTVFTTTDNCLVKYLYYYIKLKINLNEQCCNTSTIPNIDKKVLSIIPIPLPPLDIQTRIVEQLDNIYENEIENSEKIIEGLETSIQTIIHNTLYRDDLTKYKIRELCTCISGKIQTSKIINNGTYPVISKGRPSCWKYINTHTIDGDNVFTATEYSGDGGGKLMINYYEGKCNTSCLAYHLKIKNSNIIAKYLYLFLKSNILVFDKRFQKGSCKKSLDLKVFYKFKVSIPPLDIQKKILTQIEPKEALITALKINITSAEQEAKDIMNQLFSTSNTCEENTTDKTESSESVNTINLPEPTRESIMEDLNMNTKPKKKKQKKKVVVSNNQ